MQFHRLACLILGIWLGISAFMDFVATSNFKMAGQALASMDVRAIETARKIGDKDAARLVMRYLAGEINRYLFEQWEWAELMLGLAFFLVLLFGRTYQKLAMTLCLAMMCIVAAQRFYLTPRITILGRELDFSMSASRRFAVFHAAYGYMEIGKLALGLVVAARLLIRSRLSKKAFVREYERADEVRP